MKAKLIKQILEKAIPRSDSWPDQIEPYGQNKLFDDEAEVKKILYCVTPSEKISAYAKANGYDLVIAHHPYTIPDIAGLTFHTALDCCKGGLNDQWKDLLGVKSAEHFDRNLGWYGEIEPIKFDDLVTKIENFIGSKILGKCASSLEVIKTVCICTGLGGLVLDSARKTNADCYILGELICAESGFNATIETGHTLSEQCGINLLRKLLPYVSIDLAPIELDIFGREYYGGQRK